MRDGIISAGLDAAVEPACCFSVSSELQFNEADHQQPLKGEDIARGQANCFVDMASGALPLG
jgi:hypothetical protein